jgi:hypothetical protein
MPNWADEVENIDNRGDLAAFIRDLAEDLRRNRSQWENADLASYLEAAAAWVDDMDGYYKNVRGKPVPELPSWGIFADILAAASKYE